MKNILFIAQIKNTNDSLFCENLIGFLSNHNYAILILTNRELNINNQIVYLNTIRQKVKYDLVIAYNKQALHKAKKFSDNIPIFYCYSVENNIQERVNIYDYDKLFVMGKPAYPIHDNSCLFVNTLFKSKQQNKDKKNIVAVAVNSSDTIEMLTPFMNILLSETFHLLSVSQKVININFNPNIKVIRNQEKILDSFISSKTIIGEGQSAIRGILMEKPVLVLGKYGYGGLVTKENIDILYKHGFLGRIGGVQNEYLPFELIEYDLNKSRTLTKNELKKLKHYVKNLIQKEYHALSNNIEFYINLKKQNKNEVKLVKNELYMLVSISDSFYLQNRLNKQLVYELNKSEASFFNFFNEPATLIDFFRNNQRMQVTNDLMNDLISLKALVYET